jgi:phage-related protein
MARVGGIDIVIRYDNDANSYRTVLREIQRISTAGRDVSRNMQSGFSGVRSSIRDVGREVSSVSSIMRNLSAGIKLALGAMAVNGFADFVGQSVKASSDLNEVQNMVNVTFAGMTDSVDLFAQNAKKSFGLTELQAKGMIGVFGSMLVSTGYMNTDALKMSKTMTALAGDISSFTNIPIEQSRTALKAIISGETDSIENSIGATMKIASLQEYLAKHGMDVAWTTMTNAQQTLVRYNYLLESTKFMQKDFLRTQDQWANKTRVLAGTWTELKSTLGTSFIIAFSPAIDMLQKILDGMIKVSTYATAMMKVLFGVKPPKVDNNAKATTAANKGLDAQKAKLDSVADAAKKAKGQVANFDNVIMLSKPDDSKGKGSDVMALGIPEVDYGDQSKKKFEVSFNVASKLLDEFKKKLHLSINFDFIKENLLSAYESAKNTLATLGNLVVYIGLSVANTIDLSGIFEGFTKTLSKFMHMIDTITSVGSVALKNFYDVGLKPIVEWIGVKLKDALKFAGEEFDKWSEWFTKNKDKIAEFGSKLGEVVAVIWSMIEPLADAAWETFKGIISLIADIMREVFQFILDNQELVTTALTIFLGLFAGFKIGSGIATLVKTVKGIITVVGELGGIVEVAMGALEGLWAILLANPIGLIIAAVVGLVAGFVYLWKTNDDFRNFFINTWKGIKEFFLTLVNMDFKKTFGFFGNMLNGVRDNVMSVVDGVKKIFGGLITFIKGVFTGDWKSAWGGLKTALAGIFDTFGNIILMPLKNFIDLINLAIRGLNKIKMPDWVPGVGGMSINIPLIPKPNIALANGGIVTKATNALVGEAGTEAVIPLQNSSFIEMFVSKIADKLGGTRVNGGITIEKLVIENAWGDDQSMRELTRKIMQNLILENERLGRA